MARAGLIEEIMNDAIDGALGDEELEEETDAEIAKVLQEVAGEVIAALPEAAKPTKVGWGARGAVRSVCVWGTVPTAGAKDRMGEPSEVIRGQVPTAFLHCDGRNHHALRI
jgi:hypothetical protein